MLDEAVVIFSFVLMGRAAMYGSMAVVRSRGVKSSSSSVVKDGRRIALVSAVVVVTAGVTDATAVVERLVFV